MGFFKPNVSTGGSSDSVESVDISHLQPKDFFNCIKEAIF